MSKINVVEQIFNIIIHYNPKYINITSNDICNGISSMIV